MTPLLTTAEIAKMLKTSEESVRARAAGKRRPYLPAVEFRGQAKTTYRFNLEQVEARLKQLEVDDVIRRHEEEKLTRKAMGY
jgi:hypothetical protein